MNNKKVIISNQRTIVKCRACLSYRHLREGCGGRPQGGAQHGSGAHPAAARPRAVRLPSGSRRAGARPNLNFIF
ncbi:hypothetical protein DES35_10173 [Schleiferia thermophila]|uniref:Uncharacterized protein n=1 Tax=Schleiferia thermophila TaxID=884107 RepID=A0A369A6M6_9FLAO|nr:hypothetical protein DES35_10173 [Schleiferia thermophila]